jgi:hypothetical protein
LSRQGIIITAEGSFGVLDFLRGKKSLLTEITILTKNSLSINEEN